MLSLTKITLKIPIFCTYTPHLFVNTAPFIFSINIITSVAVDRIIDELCQLCEFASMYNMRHSGSVSATGQ